ncbi:MAG: hypothetical protein SFX73_20935 [Kofleriaceae bacterium]|nr:hypothetical protein [Kofleriaceae bacterium]
MRAFVLVTSLSLSLYGCVRSDKVVCGDVVCPGGTHCGPANECVPDACGNDRIDGIEECDGDDSIDRETLRCTDYGFYKGGPLTCSETCVVDTSQCSETCGDYTINGPERCDGMPPTGLACADFGFDVGTIGCASSCTPEFGFCSNLGWQLVPGGADDELYAVYLAAPSTGVAVGRAGEIIAAVDGVWLPVTQTVTTDDLNAIAATADGIFAVGNNGTILRYDGVAVTTMASPTTQHLRGVSGGAPGAFAVGDNGTILRFDGTSWASMPSPVTTDLYAVHVNEGRAFAVGESGTILQLQASGWTQLTPANLPAVTYYAVHVFADAVIVSGGLTTLARIQGNTATVANRPVPDVRGDVELRGLWAASATDIYAAGGGGLVVHWGNTSHVTKQDTPTNRTIFGLASAGDRIVGVTRGGSVIAFNGTSRHVQQPTDFELYAVYTDAVQTVAAGRVLLRARSSDGWWDETAMPANLLPAADAVRSVFPIGNDIYLGSRTLGLFKSIAGGTPTNVSAAAVNGLWATSSPLRIVTVGAGIIESTDGTSFSQTTTTTAHGANMLRGVWAAPDGVWYAVGDNGVVLRRAPSDVWTAMSSNTTKHLLAVWGTAADDVFAVGELGTIIHWDGSRWRQHYSGVAENLVSISGNTHSDVFVTGTSFTRLHYDGISWSRMAAYELESPAAATFRGTTYYVAGKLIERTDRVMANGAEVRCQDPFDNNAKDGTNCDDPTCKDELQCRLGGACETLERVTCETSALATSTYSGVARITDLPCLDHSTPGPEASFRYVAMTSGEVTVAIEDATHQLDLVVTDGEAGHCVLQTCRPAIASGDRQSVTFTATAGRMYYIVVDGPVGIGAPFTLSVACM